MNIVIYSDIGKKKTYRAKGISCEHNQVKRILQLYTVKADRKMSHPANCN